MPVHRRNHAAEVTEVGCEDIVLGIGWSWIMMVIAAQNL